MHASRGWRPHDPVMVAEVVGFLTGADRRGTVVDMTLGAGGHTEALLEAGVERVVGVDRDPSAVVDRHRASRAIRRPLPLGTSDLPRGRRGHDRGPGRWRAVRPRRLVDAARSAGTRVQLPQRRAARHAHGRRGGRRADGGRAREHAAGSRARRRDLRARRGTPLAPDRRARSCAAGRSPRRTSSPAWSWAPWDGDRGAPTPRVARSRRSASRSTGRSRSSPPPCLRRSGSSLPGAAWS